MKFTPRTVLAVVVANMIGAGVFTSLGFQLLEFRSGFVILALWAVGGVIALCGALSYAELGAALPRSGGEYNFLSRIYHPSIGFVAGWVSATIGFAAPTALIALTFGAYLQAALPSVSSDWLAAALIALLTLAHSSTRTMSARTQTWFTGVKVALILVFCVSALQVAPQWQAISFAPNAADLEQLTGGAFAVALIYVAYAYTGWNAATYLSGEIENPERSLSKVLLFGTLIVTLLYLLLNATFLLVAPAEAMAGHAEIGHIAAAHAFGSGAGNVMGVMLALLFISTASAMIMAGPRTLQCLGEDFAVFSVLARKNAHGVPTVAILVQSALSLVFVFTATLEQVLVFAGFTLGVSTFLTVLGVLVLRVREGALVRPYRVPWYPLPPILFLLLTGWTLVYIAFERPSEALWGGAIIALGGLLYVFSARSV
ncbi:MAG: amino acid permease [Gammaproteobacteria bacterium]|nr:amino acid permease [Gammaproteobacteria bacterium]